MITIGKLAALFGITHHQIRYYEEKQLFAPTAVDENGYRQYDIDAVYRLAQILLLRELQLGTAEINKIQHHYNEADYQLFIGEKINELDEQIRKLTHTKKQLQRQLGSDFKETYSQEHLPTFYLEKVLTLNINESLTAEKISQQAGLEHLLTEDIYYLFEQDVYHLCKKTEDSYKSIAIHAATYEVYTDYIQNEVESDQMLNLLAEKHQRFPDFVIERNTFTLNQLNKVEIAYYFNCTPKEKRVDEN